ncbi:helix-turn-helix domain-containing protein [Mycoplasmopsis cricetuli]|uniref:helix-turn-helix domain-containing protein n=1 Tax=Mycoplasmopsis cricetuli TaxID=171283 RepID=UPI0012EB7B5D|nr:DnaA/Hda family protein [Mycoplasmopsis cricetuli]
MKQNLKEDLLHENRRLSVLTSQFKEYIGNKVDNFVFTIFFQDMSVIKCEKKEIIFYNPKINDDFLLKYEKEIREPLNIAVKDIIKSDEYVWKFINIDLEEYKSKIKEQKVTQKKIKETIKSQIQNEKINENFSFANYIQSEFNQEPIKIFEKILENNDNDDDLSVVYLSGKSGLGKTHLLHALIKEYRKNNKTTFYVSPYNFTTYISNLIKENNPVNTSSVLKHFSNLDLLVFDDFHIFAEGKKIATKNFLFSIIDKRISLNKLTIFASEHEVKDLVNMFEERFITRLRSGFQTKIQKPNKEDLEKIFSHLLTRETKIEINMLDRKSVDWIIKGHSSSIRDLSGAVKRLSFYKKEIVNSDYVYNVVKNIFKDFVAPDKKITPEIILEAVSKYYKISTTEMTGKSRNKQIVIARHMGINLINVILNYPSTQIGKIFKKDHSTILNAIEKFKNCSNEVSIKKAFEVLKRQIENN